MTLPNQTQAYVTWAPVVGRVFLGGLFLMGAAFKVPGTASFAMEAGMTAAAGVPFAQVAVFLAFLLELGAGLAVVLGYHARVAAFLLALFTVALTLIFHSNFSDPMEMGQFVSHLGLIGGLLFVSVYGAKQVAIRKD